MRFLPVFILLALSPSSWGQSSDQQVQNQKKAQESLELKLAKLWGRFDELEIKVKKQAERIKLLEKGLMLGVIPEKLLEDKLQLGATGKPPMDCDDGPRRTAAVPEKTKRQVSQIPKDEFDYPELLSRAQEAFSSGNYGQAIAFYQRIEKSYREKIAEGQTKYWIGLSWYYLKEYEQSQENFEMLIDSYPDSPWIPKAKFYRAKISLHKGLPERALRQFNRLISAYPNSETSEMATYEIKLLKERL